jgi:hypothetical protein
MLSGGLVGDEPYSALLPWAVFALIDRAHGGGPLWAACGAMITAVALLATSSRRERPARSVIMIGAVVWFTGLAVAGAMYGAHTGLVAHDGRALSATGFAVLAFGSLAFTPASDYYLRPYVRTGRLDEGAYQRLNVLITLIWATTFTAIAASHVLAVALGSAGASTVFNWVVPMALTVVAAHRTRVGWDDFNDDDLFEPDPLRDLALDWESPSVRPTDR